MTLTLRQVALVTTHLDAVTSVLHERLGCANPWRDPDIGVFGLQNAVVALDDTFLEVVSPITAGTAAGRLLDRRGADGGYMVILQTDALCADRARLARLGVRIVADIQLPDMHALHLHPKDTGGAMLSLDAPQPLASWRWGGPRWPHDADRSKRIVCCELRAAAPAALAARWSELLARPCEPCDAGHRIALDGGELRFAQASSPQHEGIYALDLCDRTAAYPTEITLCGVRIRCVPPA